MWWYVAKKKKTDGARSTRGPRTPETALQATKGVSAGSYITQQYLSGAGVHHHELCNTGYWNIQMPRFPAERRFLFYKAWTYCITVVGIWNGAVSVGGLCCASKITWRSWVLPSGVEGGLWLFQLHHSAPWEQGGSVNSVNHQNRIMWFAHNENGRSTSHLELWLLTSHWVPM